MGLKYFNELKNIRLQLLRIQTKLNTGQSLTDDEKAFISKLENTYNSKYSRKIRKRFNYD